MPINFPYDNRTPEEIDQDQHFWDFKDGYNNDCNCGLCQYWREQERIDLENI